MTEVTEIFFTHMIKASLNFDNMHINKHMTYQQTLSLWYGEYTSLPIMRPLIH